jgi:hypothetical protein
MTRFQAVDTLKQAYCAQNRSDVSRPSTPEAGIVRNLFEIDQDPRINLVAPSQ